MIPLTSAISSVTYLDKIQMGFKILLFSSTSIRLCWPDHTFDFISLPFLMLGLGNVSILYRYPDMRLDVILLVVSFPGFKGYTTVK